MNGTYLRPLEIQRALESVLPMRFWENIAGSAKPYIPAHELNIMFWMESVRLSMSAIPGGETEIFWRSVNAGLLASVAKWRMTKGIYRFDPDLLRELTDTPMPNDAPCDIFRRIPEPCVWVDLGGACGIDGYFAFFQDNLLCLNVDIGIGILYPILAYTEAKNVGEATRIYEGTDRGRFELPIKTSALFSTLLYLCSEEPDYGGRQPPVYQEPKRSKRDGWIPKQKPEIWDVGVRLGAAIRQYQASERHTDDAESTGRTVRPHIRRAHWHGFWTGPRKEPAQQKFVHKWIPPIPVNVAQTDEGELPAVIRDVK